MDVAVKQLNRNGLQGHKEWIAEVDFLSIVKHPNLVKLVGYCAEDDERGIQRLLVYELMPNKSLEDHLLLRGATPLPWGLRLRIAQDAARGLAYLHEEMDFQLIFRDFKTSNILLDEDFNAKLSDFGLARQGPAEGLDHVSTSVVGTVGYVSPEYVQNGRLSAKSDVWSFGVVLYELLTGRRSVDRNLPRGEQKLLEWVKPYVSDSKKLHIIIDPRLEGQYCMKSVQKLVSLANKCLMKQPKSRPKMSEVVEMLGQIIEMSNVVEVVEKAPQDEFESSREGNGSSKTRIFDVREIVSLRNRSSGRMYWNALPPGMTRTWC
ncbi:putative receptor-like protein kinase [Acorus calamus]|uniref:Receptor-like protein kinase n=1 Tax=Acorus calamus TaxID=4465 RepID=A0AAV9DF91_ACOCL|nr:putative receptor-like protein kinase [Acorus calamus]